MYKIMHYKYFRGSDQSGAYEIKRISRKRDAIGFLKQSFKSQLQVMMVHEQLGDDFEVVEDVFLVRGWDEKGTTYTHFFFMEKIDGD